MGNINGRFADQDSYVLTGQVQTSNNNQSTLNAAIAETDHLRASSVLFQSTGLLATVANPVPNVSTVTQNTIGAALGGIGQAGTPSTQPGGGGNPCFLGHTLFSLWMPNNIIIRVPIARLYGRNHSLHALSYDDQNNRAKGEIVEIFRNVKEDYLHVTFEDDYATDVVAEHRYWTPEGYVCIKDLLGEYVYTEDNQPIRVSSIHKVKVKGGIPVYNAHIKDYQNYCADCKRVHNLKPIAPDVG